MSSFEIIGPGTSRTAQPSNAATELAEQQASNRSAIGDEASFAAHQERLTSVVAKGVKPAADFRLCVLGAGNCYDLDLERLTRLYREVHLVDIDEVAVGGAMARQSTAAQARIFCHAPLDCSGLMHRIDRWKAMNLAPEELMEYPAWTWRNLAAALEGPFDVVLSACLLTQLQFTVRKILTPQFPLFETVRHALTLAHLLTLAALTQKGGRAILATDVVSSETYPLASLDPAADLRQVMHELIATKQVIAMANPALIAWMGRADPVLARSLDMSPPEEVWLWQNGPEMAFLVYAMEMLKTE